VEDDGRCDQRLRELQKTPDTTDRGWIVLTHNRADFTMLHDAWHLWAHAWRVNPKHAGIIVLEQVDPSRHAEVATLTHELCKQALLLNTLFDWKPTTGWVRNPR
jgi:hypothetical protein